MDLDPVKLDLSWNDTDLFVSEIKAFEEGFIRRGAGYGVGRMTAGHCL